MAIPVPTIAIELWSHHGWICLTCRFSYVSERLQVIKAITLILVAIVYTVTWIIPNDTIQW